MAEQFLDHAKVSSVLKKMARKGVSHDVRGNCGGSKSSPRGKRFEVACEDLSRKMAAFSRGGKKPGIVAGIAQRLGASVAVKRQCLDG